MPKDTLDEREFELVNIIGSELDSSQRDLSRLLDLSLGATNMLIRRLIAKGYIRIKQLNQRKVQYILTPKGFAEKMRKSIKYTWKTINSIGTIKKRIGEVISALYEKGERNFFILGESDFALLVDMAFKEMDLKDCHVTFVKEIPRDWTGGVLLICKENVDMQLLKRGNQVDLVHELAHHHSMIDAAGTGAKF